ncbi:hypothetical protein [Grimontia sp. NTOU-MAR1]|uniref:hypothetical protein n=1 Tax=Grimontia sp. NTOU-MAR1 TaxID=3111011 RepID=UPI002DB9271A|nr:hypothetical protein [Grimontia sp. NTOU-MAR1]WRW00159.1 hypothetical protein VP504_24570 [Grimontia sp. NTOU-MAR1]
MTVAIGGDDSVRDSPSAIEATCIPCCSEVVEIPIVGGQDVMTVGILSELDKDEYSLPNKIFCKIKYHSA